MLRSLAPDSELFRTFPSELCPGRSDEVRRTRHPEILASRAAIPLDRGLGLTEELRRTATPWAAHARLNIPHHGRFDTAKYLAHWIVPGFEVWTPRFKPPFRGAHRRRCAQLSCHAGDAEEGHL